MEVSFSKKFKYFFIEKLSEKDQKIIYDFKVHVEKYGLVGLKGKNKKSDHPSPKKGEVECKLESEYAYAHNLWHYHIGIPDYRTDSGFGHYTSKFVLHYQRFQDSINIVKMDHHSPFQLPTNNYFN